MEAFLPDTVKTILLGVIAVVLVLAWLAHAFPRVAWLQVFRIPTPLDEEERARRARAANRLAGVEMILAGLVLPILYVAATVMMFNDFKTAPAVIVGALSLSLIALGLTALGRNW